MEDIDPDICLKLPKKSKRKRMVCLTSQVQIFLDSAVVEHFRYRIDFLPNVGELKTAKGILLYIV